jgi:hypothetical protein
MPSRRTHLTSRLVSGEITLEEARELFKDMSEELSILRQRSTVSAPAPTPAETPAAQATPTKGRDIGLEELLLFVGPAAGLFAAVIKRSKEDH